MADIQTDQMDITFLNAENERLTAQVAALRMCCVDLGEIVFSQCKKHKESPVGRTHMILNVEIPKILRATKPQLSPLPATAENCK